LLRGLGPLRWRDLTFLLVGTLLGLVIVNVVPFETPSDSWFIFLSGALAICAMILPGISGSFILLLLRKYEHVFDAIGHFDFAVILPFALGAVSGLMLFSRLLVWLLKHHYRITLTTIVGMLVGSLWLLWPFQARSYEIVRGKQHLVYSSALWPVDMGAGEILAGVLCLAGIATVLIIDMLARRRQATEHGLL
jgi:putative membrane protein